MVYPGFCSLPKFHLGKSTIHGVPRIFIQRGDPNSYLDFVGKLRIFNLVSFGGGPKTLMWVLEADLRF